MKTKTLILNLALLAALPVAANETTLQYHLSGEKRLSMEQDIYVEARSDAIGEEFRLHGDGRSFKSREGS
jgi:hypothetical protein